jgi:hypothetical protein
VRAALTDEVRRSACAVGSIVTVGVGVVDT